MLRKLNSSEQVGLHNQSYIRHNRDLLYEKYIIIVFVCVSRFRRLLDLWPYELCLFLAEINDAKMTQQAILIEDQTKSIAAEQLRNSALTEEVTTLKEKNSDLETNLATAGTEVEHLKQLLSTENQRLASIQ